MSEQLLDTIDVVDDNIHMIVWDLGRRCNFDCTYCTTYMHNNWSPHASLEKLKETANCIFVLTTCEVIFEIHKFKTFETKNCPEVIVYI